MMNLPPKAYPFVTAISFGIIALTASVVGASDAVLTLLGTLAGYVLGATR